MPPKKNQKKGKKGGDDDDEFWLVSRCSPLNYTKLPGPPKKLLWLLQHPRLRKRQRMRREAEGSWYACTVTGVELRLIS